MNGLFSPTNSLNFDLSNATLGLWAYSASRLLLDKGFRENKVEKHQLYFKVLVSKKKKRKKKGELFLPIFLLAQAQHKSNNNHGSRGNKLVETLKK
jgi:hypothetical protein